MFLNPFCIVDIVEQNTEQVMHLAQRGYVMDKGAVAGELDGAAVASQETLIRYLSV